MRRPLLIPMIYFCLQTWLGATQATHKVNLTMEPDAFDDQYLGCANEMDELAPGLLEEEMSKSLLFRKVWKIATEKWERVKTKISLPRGFTDEHGRAIIAYSDKYKYNNEAFQRTFNEAVRGAGVSRVHYMDSFQFKAFHYYLTRALQLLRGSCEETYNLTVYWRVFETEVACQEKPFRFGYFASSSMNRERAQRFSVDKLFAIHTCFGVQIKSFSHFPEQEEVLIPIHEMFNASQAQGNNGFALLSTNQTCSYFNCAYLGGEKNQTCVDNSAPRGGLTFPRECSSFLFGGSVILVQIAALKLFSGF
ncbi:ecto-ADP-ribosyltransferase 5-like [Carettochelys insculpta]|uniref:ecto-ADP-ribosyltransferase 5-like n=1 Tax=Carettochelys insculpta TaxID=44489 RepID=UPI003EBE9B1C